MTFFIRALFKKKAFKVLLNEVFQTNDPTFKASQHKYKLAICSGGIRIMLADDLSKSIVIEYDEVKNKRLQANILVACDETLNQLNTTWKKWEENCQSHMAESNPHPKSPRRRHKSDLWYRANEFLVQSSNEKTRNAALARRPLIPRAISL